MYDAIVVGARCGGAPTAMLLARAGHRVLLVDRAAFPSDTLSTHFLHPPALTALARWGLLDEAAAGCPRIERTTLDLGPVVLTGAPPPAGGIAWRAAPRRIALDEVLVRAAVTAGAELRERFTVSDLVVGGGVVSGIRGTAAGGPERSERARIVVGADGGRSTVARLAGARPYRADSILTCAYYGYWSGLGVREAVVFSRPGQAVIAFPTSGDLTVVYVAWPHERFDAVRRDLKGSFRAAVRATAPELSERMDAGRREGRIAGTGSLPNFFRPSGGAGWALVGDAGHHEDPFLARGITNALHDAGLLAEALHAGLAGREPMAAALARHQRRRDAAALPLYELNLALASLGPPPPALAAGLAAMAADQSLADRFIGVLSGTVPVAEILAPAA